MTDIRDLKSALKEKLLKKDGEVKTAIGWSDLFCNAIERLYNSLEEFVGDTPVKISRSDQRVFVYEKGIVFRHLNISTELAQFNISPRIILGGDEPLKSKFVLNIGASKIESPFEQAIFFNPEQPNAPWYVSRSLGVTMNPFGDPVQLEEKLEITNDNFCRAVFIALT
jgi:hypothetical protein